MKYYLGLDNGGTTTKAALYTPDGTEVGISSTETRMITSRPGFTERDMEEMWDANCKVIREVIINTGVDPSDIAGIACCGHGKGLYLWGKNGKPVRNGIISSDNRAYEYPLKWKKDGTEQKVFEISYQKILACQPVSLLAWLKDHEPQAIPETQWIFECKDYVRFRLTGQAFAEMTDYSGANLMNLSTQQYDQELLDLFGLSEIMDKLPPLRASFDICGHITEEVSAQTGLIAGTPVAGGMFDIDACAIAVDAAYEDRVCMIAGTWSINEYMRDTPVTNGSVDLNSLFCIPGYYLIEESSATSAGNNEWFINTLMPELKAQAASEQKNIYQIVNEMVASIPPEEYCPIFTPFLMASNVHPNAKASFIGISNFHKREHIVRSVFEGIAFSHKFHFEKLLATRKEKLSCIRLAGGAAKSTVWAQMFADIMEYPVQVVDINETGTLGCAMAAAVATGEYKDYWEAAKAMVRSGASFLPDKNHISAYRKRYAVYKRILSSLDGIWDDVQDLIV